MDPYTELLLEAIAQCDINSVKFCLQKGAKVNKICSTGVTALGAAAQSGNFQILKLLGDSTKKIIDLDIENDNPLILHLDLENKQYKNFGYFVVCKDLDELDDGPTPDGMENLEWDMEITDDNTVEELPTPPEISIYKWYAKILNQTSVMLKSPENDIGRLDKNGQSVLHYAVSIGHLEMVQYLDNNFQELSVNQMNNNWLSPLHLAVMGEHLHIVKYLIEKGANVNAPNSKRETPLHFAAHKNNLDIINVFLEHKANVNVYDMEERSPLTISILNSNEHVARFLIKAGTRLNHEEAHGYTVLHRSVWANLYESTKLLLEAGAKIVQSHYLVHVATRNGNLEIVKLLHKHKAVLNVRDEQGNTSLMLACKFHCYEIAQYLLENGVPANTVNHINGMTALHVCAQKILDPVLFQKFLDLLLDHKANINANSYQGHVLFYSIILGNLKCAAILIKHGANVNLRDEHAYFDNLSLAMKQGNLDLVRLMIHAGFNMNNMLFNISSLKNGQDDQVYDYLVYVKKNPLNLRELCRIKVRKALGTNLPNKIQQLPLPSIMVKYLALDLW